MRSLWAILTPIGCGFRAHKNYVQLRIACSHILVWGHRKRPFRWGAFFFVNKSQKWRLPLFICWIVGQWRLANGQNFCSTFLPPPTSLSLQNTTPRTHCSPSPAFDCFSIVPFSQHRPTDCHGDACVPRPWCWRAGDTLSIALRDCCPVPFKVCVQSQLLAGGWRELELGSQQSLQNPTLPPSHPDPNPKWLSWITLAPWRSPISQRRIWRAKVTCPPHTYTPRRP